ncbi:hypothetical protein M1K46_18320 [Fictibacillus sp. WQ 8-8]|uniref:hypothetical protein n=1 Tax=Fictibacillus sp. WQ 8-8 TaxID=2938788 RepID=UPI00210E95EA|nr:hypothetical protein [Fictibacillus sp. WQ 8-8]MCQ6267592.1 hypothetical protein [Fictibacillus sp. WQ 8-8]
MIGILLIVVAVILIAVLIVINTRAFAAKGKANTADENKSPVAEEPIQKPVQEETAAAAQENHENMAPPSPAIEENVPEKDPNAMSDTEYRHALRRLKTPAKPAAPPAETTEKHSMKDNDYRNALKSMNKKRDN